MLDNETHYSRRFAMVQMRDEGQTLEEIGRQFNLTRERVRQIIDMPSRSGKTFAARDKRLEWLKDYGRQWNRAASFWAKADRSGDCWEWTFSKFPTGYGHTNFAVAKNTYLCYAHRVAFYLWNGHAPSGPQYAPTTLQVLHSCDNPGCVNPAHLWLGTIADNMHDRDSKGRGRPWGNGPARHGTTSMYAKHGCRCQECARAGRDYGRMMYWRHRDKRLAQAKERYRSRKSEHKS